jgi:His-Xaa-Ser system protein HxsD
MIEPALSFDRSAASLDAVQRAVYRLSDRLSCDISEKNGLTEVLVHPVDAEADIGSLLGDLRNEVLDQALRERIRAETSAVRNLVLALAFSKTGLAEGDV